MIIPVRFLSVNKFHSSKSDKDFAKLSVFGADGTVYNLFLDSRHQLPNDVSLLDRFDIDITFAERSEGGYNFVVNGIYNYQPSKIKFD